MAGQSISERPSGSTERLKTRAYDRVSSWILTLLVVVGLAVGVLWVAWWTGRQRPAQTAVPVIQEQINTDENLDINVALAGPPSPTELQKEVRWPQQEIGRTVSLLSQLVRWEGPRWEEGTWEQPAGQGGTDTRRGGRSLGWEIRFDPGNTLETYAKQLDFFGIELGVLLPDNQILYVGNLSKAEPTLRQGPADQESRYYFTWRQGELLAADRELLRKAGVDPKDRLILKFLPDKWVAELLRLEKQQAGQKGQNVRETRFGIRAAGEGYEFYVLEQIYR